MQSKFLFLTKMSLMKKIKSKTFIIVNLFLFIMLVSITNIDKIVSFFGGDFGKQNCIYVVDKTNETFDIFKTSLKTSEKIADTNIKYKIKKINNEKEVKKKISNKKDIGIIIDNDNNDIISVKMITQGYISANVYQFLQNSINLSKQNVAMSRLNISQDDLKKISKSVNIDREYIKDNINKSDEDTNMIMGILVPVVILPFFLLTVLIIQMIGAEINEEKSTKSMEIIISNVSAKVHFFSKIISANLFIMMQTILLFIYTGIGILIRGGFSSSNKFNVINDMLPEMNINGVIDKVIPYLPFVIILMLITIFAYSILSGILVSVTTNMEDFQQIQTPIMIVLLVGFYLSLMSSMFEGSIFIRILSYVPFISAIISPSLLLTGVIGYKDIILSILLMIAVIYLLLKYGIKIYKEGILNYSNTNIWRKIIKLLKN